MILFKVISLRVRIFLFNSFILINWSNSDSLFCNTRGTCSRFIFLIWFISSRCLLRTYMSSLKDLLFSFVSFFLGLNSVLLFLSSVYKNMLTLVFLRFSTFYYLSTTLCYRLRLLIRYPLFVLFCFFLMLSKYYPNV